MARSINQAMRNRSLTGQVDGTAPRLLQRFQVFGLIKEQLGNHRRHRCCAAFSAPWPAAVSRSQELHTATSRSRATSGVCPVARDPLTRGFLASWTSFRRHSTAHPEAQKQRDARKHGGPFYEGGYPQAGKQSGIHTENHVPPWEQ